MLRPNEPVPMRFRWLFAAVAALLAVPAAGAAQDSTRSYAYGALSDVEGDVWLQRADDFGANEAEPNSPFLPGDRLWTREPGQAEVRFAGRVTAWLHERTKLDYVEGDEPHRLGFWTGSLLLRVGDDASVVVESPGGSLAPQSAGRFRLDVLEEGQGVRFVALEGIATVQSDAGSVVLATGQRTVSSADGAPSAPENIDGVDQDALMEWADSRDASRALSENVPYDELPDEVQEHVHDLQGHGHWRRDPHLGWAWYPTVAAGWAPYHYGRWAYTPFGHTWISYDPWGWAPYHYGRWGYGSTGWYWLPGSHWGPAWVSWAWGPDWIGWSPLGYYNRPVYGFHAVRGGFYGGGARPGTVVGRAVARGEANRRARPRHGWSFADRSAMGRAGSRNRLDVSTARNLRDARVSGRGAVLDRNLRERAVGRTAIATSTASTVRNLSNARRGAMVRDRRATAGAQRLAAPARSARSRATAGPAPGTVPWTSGAASRSAPRAAPRATGNRLGGRPGASRTARPPRPRAAPSGGGARRPSSVRPSSRPSSAAPRSRPSRPSSSPSSAAPRSRPSRPSSAAPRSRPSRPSSAAPRSRPSRPSSAAPRSRPSRPSSSSRPSSAAPRSRPSRPSSAAPRSRPSRPSSAAPRSRPSRPSSSSRPRSRPNR